MEGSYEGLQLVCVCHRGEVEAGWYVKEEGMSALR